MLDIYYIMKEIISEEIIRETVQKVILLEAEKVKRDDYNRLQFKIEELQNSLSETIKELRKLEGSVPGPLKKITDSRINTVSTNLVNSQKIIGVLKEKIKSYKKHIYLKQLEERKKKI